jgi:hypothetical protein
MVVMEKALAPMACYRVTLRLYTALEDIRECLHFSELL